MDGVMRQTIQQMHADTSRCDAVELCRRYVQKHDTTTLSNLHSDEKKIAPLWAKVTETPFLRRAKLTQGYGRDWDKPIKRCTVSRDTMASILDPEKVKQPANRMDSRTACVTRVDPRANPREMAIHSLPGGLSLHAHTSKVPRARHKGVKYENRTLLNVLVTDRDERKPIEWRPRNTARS